MNQKLVFMFWLLLGSLATLSQETKPEQSREGSHRLTMGLGHTYLAHGKNSAGKTVWLPKPSWSLNYDYWINDTWAIGLQTDLVLEKFIVVVDDHIILERDKPLALVPVALFKPGRHFSFMAGGGIEVEKEETLGVSRLSMAYDRALAKGWEVGMAFTWDDKWSDYNSWLLEFTFSKVFYRKKAKNGQYIAF